MLTIKLNELMNDGRDCGMWVSLMNVEKKPDVAFDIRNYWKSHITPNCENFTEEHRKIMDSAGATASSDGILEVPDNISETRRKKLNDDFQTLCGKEIKIPHLKYTLRQVMRACRSGITEAMLDGLDKYCESEEKPPPKKKK